LSASADGPRCQTQGRVGPLRRLRGPTPAGNWSSSRPHKHDEDKDGETSLEEIYYFETRVTPGVPQRPGADDAIGYHRVCASDERPIDVSAKVRTGDVVLVPYGWHGPGMAAPGYDMYYLNVMAGPGPVRDWLISDDPHRGWIRQTWEGQGLDPRLPFAGEGVADVPRWRSEHRACSLPGDFVVLVNGERGRVKSKNDSPARSPPRPTHSERPPEPKSQEPLTYAFWQPNLHISWTGSCRRRPRRGSFRASGT
jgi:hypothetical protein